MALSGALDDLVLLHRIAASLQEYGFPLEAMGQWYASAEGRGPSRNTFL